MQHRGLVKKFLYPYCFEEDDLHCYHDIVIDDNGQALSASMMQIFDFSWLFGLRNMDY